MTKEEFRAQYQDGDKLLLRPLTVDKDFILGSFWVSYEKGDRVRAQVEDKNIFVFQKGKKRRGYRALDEQVLEHFAIVEEDEDEKWRKRVKRVIKKLSDSGLWPNELEFFKKLENVDYNDKKLIDRLYWDKISNYKYSCDMNIEVYNKFFKDVYKDYLRIYPFMFFVNDEGMYCLDHSYTWEKSDVVLKSMYFGKNNANIKKEISQALKSRTRYSHKTRVNYDVSFEYDPEKNMAWYSEEYKDCGNGHYYIALDANTALFVEND